jgi:ketol-acid reductoisomerase
MHIFRDEDANLELVQNKKIGIIGYGNQGRAQALNLRDNGMDVMIGNRPDDYAKQAHEDGFQCLSIIETVKKAQIIMLLIPDEEMPRVFDDHILPGIKDPCTLVFASGYNIAFNQLVLPLTIDVILLAPRMIGAGVRDHFINGKGFPSFIGVEQDVSGNARQTALALAKGIGSTSFGVVEVTFKQEAELDLFTEQCFGPAFGNVLTTAVDLLLELGYPPEAVLLELYMSGELAYTFHKIAEMGIIAQSDLHSRTSQYGSLTRGASFLIPEIRERMEQGFEEIRSGRFAREWLAEQENGAATLDMMREVAKNMPLYNLEKELLEVTRGKTQFERADTGDFDEVEKFEPISLRSDLENDELMKDLKRFLTFCESDAKLIQFAETTSICIQYQIDKPEILFFMQFNDGRILTDFGDPETEANITLLMDSELMDKIFSRKTNPMRAALSGKLRFKGDTRLAMRVQKIQDDFCRLYIKARS